MQALLRALQPLVIFATLVGIISQRTSKVRPTLPSIYIFSVLCSAPTQSIIDLLLTSGADPSLKDSEGRMAKDFDYQPPAEGEDGGEDAAKMEL